LILGTADSYRPTGALAGAEAEAEISPASAPGRACPFRSVCPGVIAARTMIVVIPQLICCFISMKIEIPHDYGAPGSAGAAASLRTALTATTDH
jgi:hypothetical protein